MSLEIAFLFGLLAVMVYLFMTEKIPVDLTAFGGLVILLFTGYLAPEEAFTGFASSAVITMLSIFIVGAALLQTGLADIVGKWVQARVGEREIPLMITIMLVAAVLSAFMNNIAAVAVLMPAVASIARRCKVPPSQLFMPLSFAAILGGTTTLVGTPPNILAAAMMEERGMDPFELFDFTPVGVVLVVLGILFMVTVGRKLLPVRETGPALTESRDLAEIYQLQERMFSLRIPRGSRLDGMSLSEARLTETLGVQVIAISSGARRRLMPQPTTTLRGGNTLLVEGRLEDLRELLRVQGLHVDKARVRELPRPIAGVSGVRARLSKSSSLVGKTLKQIGFRERFGIVVLGIQRGDEMLQDSLAVEHLEVDDELFGLGRTGEVKRIFEESGFYEVESGLGALQRLRSHLYLIEVSAGSPLVDVSIAESRIGELVGLTVAGIIRGSQTLLAVSPSEKIQADDRLLITGDPSRIVRLLEIGDVRLESRLSEPVLESEEIGIEEAILAPRSSLAGKSLKEASFRERFGVQVLALWREGRMVRTKLANLKLQFGDGLLLQGPRQKLFHLGSGNDLVILSDQAQGRRKTEKMPYALGGLLAMVLMVVTGFQPIQVAAFAAATLVVLFGALTMEEAYRAIEWRAIFLVAAVLPVGVAMERSGGAQLLAQNVTSFAGPLGPYAVLAAMILLSSLLSQCLDGAPAVVLLTPVVIQAAEQLSLSPYPIMLGVSIAASAAFMTPFSHKANLLVMGAGGYRAMDYLKVGTVLTIVLLVVMVVLVPLAFPF